MVRRALGERSSLPRFFARKEVILMAKSEVTSRKVGSIAAKILRDPKASATAKSAAGSALTQRPTKKK
jgi:uncharacterized protein YbgA (DUF1722 family)